MRDNIAGLGLLLPVLTAALFLIAVIGLGGFVLLTSGLGEARKHPVRVAPIAAALGFGLMSYIGYIILEIGRAKPICVLVTLIGCTVLGRNYLISLASGLRTSVERPRSSLSVSWWLFAVPTTLLLFLSALTWITPVHNVDALSGYMFTARWLYDHGLTFSPYNPRYSTMPLNTEVVFALTLAFGNDIVAKVLDGAMGVLFVLGIYECARRYSDRTASYCACISIAIYPPFVAILGSGKVDDVASFLAFASIALLTLTRSDNACAVPLSAVLIGTACAQKYTIWVFVPGFLLGVYLLKKKEGVPTAYRAVALAALIIVLCLVPHLVKAIIWTHNPVPPFARQWFPTQNVFVGHHTDKGTFPFWKWLVWPWSLFFDSSYHKVQLPGPFPLLLLIGGTATCLIPSRYRGTGVVLAVAFVQLGLWVAVRRDGWLVDRFLLAPVSLLLVGFSPAIDWLCLRRGLTKSIFCGGMLVLIWYQGVYVNRHRREALSIVLGRVNREQWLAQSVPGSPYADLTRLLGKLAPDQRLFLPGRLYYIPDDELAYISKEQDTVEFESVPDIEKCSYLREHHYKYYVELRAGQPPWTSALVRVAAGDEYSIFRI